MKRGPAFVVAVVSVLVSGAPVASAAAGPAKEPAIVVLRDNAGNPAEVARDHQRRHGAITRFIYQHALRGYAADLPAGARAAITRDPRVAYVERDERVSAFGEVPTGADRIEADRNATAGIDGNDDRVDVDVAILDTGISPHPDLNVVGGAQCLEIVLLAVCTSLGFADRNGHGTHVAGTAAALDNGTGVVGVAPGARLWGIKVLDDSGSGKNSAVAAGIDWVTARASTFEVANMSLGCACVSQAIHDALTRSTNAGIVYVVAAGNSATNATFTPANHPQVITVSAMADFNGRPGGGAPATCRADVDDTFADFSNFGSAVDLAAPGVCITSTANSGGYSTMSGTSMASPHGAGAAAMYIVEKAVPRSPARWSTVREGLRTGWAVAQSGACGFSQGRSGEPMLLLASC